MQVDNNDLATQSHAPLYLNDYKYSAGNLEAFEVTRSSVYWLTTMNIDKERHGFPVHILCSPISVDVFIFPVNVLYYTLKSIFFPFHYSVYSSVTALYSPYRIIP